MVSSKRSRERFRQRRNRSRLQSTAISLASVADNVQQPEQDTDSRPIQFPLANASPLLWPLDCETPLESTTPAVKIQTQEHESVFLPRPEPKRRKIESIFHHDHTEALDPSLVHPTSLLEQENNILYVQDIGKQYQLVVKDFNIQIRDNRIKAKDKQIAELGAELEEKDGRLSVVMNHHQKLSQKSAQQARMLQHKINQCEEMTAQAKEQEQSIQRASGSLQEQDALLRVLRNELEAKKTEIQDLKARRLVDHLLKWVCGLIGLSDASHESSSVFPLMQLPGEVRNIIYKQSLVLRRPIDLWPILPYNAPEISRGAVLEQDLKQINVNLLRVSRQVHKETVGILYGCNRFRFSDWGSWTILTAFLSHINSNCQFLTSISIGCIDWCNMNPDQLQTEDDLIKHFNEMQAITYRFGKAVIDSPTGPPRNGHAAFLRGREMLVKLPSLKSFTIIVQHNAQFLDSSCMYLSKVLTGDDSSLLYGELPASKPKRTIVFLRRLPHQNRIIRGRDVDDDSGMGRLKFVMLASQHDVNIKTGFYGSQAEKVSYTIKGGEDEYDVDVLEYIEQSGSVFSRTFQAARKLVGY